MRKTPADQGSNPCDPISSLNYEKAYIWNINLVRVVMRRTILLIPVLLFLFSIANASYSVKMKVLYNGRDAFIFGYITSSLSQETYNEISDLSIVLKKGDDETTYYPNFENDANEQNYLISGVFYQEIESIEEGVYTVELKIGNEIKKIEILNASPYATENEVEIISAGVDNHKLLTAIRTKGDMKINIIGRKNFYSPIKKYVSGEQYLNREYNIYSFAGDSQVFLLVVYSDTYDYKLLRTGYKETNVSQKESSEVRILNVTFDSEEVFTGEQLSFNLKIKNEGTKDELIFIEYYFDPSNKYSPGGLYLLSGREETHTFYITAPNSEGLKQLWIRIYNEDRSIDLITARNIYVVSPRYDFNIKVNGNDIVEIGTHTFNIEVTNTGTLNDVYSAEIYGIGADVGPSLSISPGESKKIDVTIHAQAPGDYNITFKVCSQRSGTCKTKFFNLFVWTGSHYTDVSIKENSKTTEIGKGTIFTINIKNLEGSSWRYSIDVEAENYDGELYVYPKNFTLMNMEEKEFYIYATPRKSGNYEITYKINKENTQISSGKLYLNVTEKSQITGYFSFIPENTWIFGIPLLSLVGLFLFYFFAIRGKNIFGVAR